MNCKLNGRRTEMNLIRTNVGHLPGRTNVSGVFICVVAVIGVDGVVCRIVVVVSVVAGSSSIACEGQLKQKLKKYYRLATFVAAFVGLGGTVPIVSA
jgi:hypothetical protein